MSVDTVCPNRVAEITSNIQRLFESGDVVELRCLGPGKALSGFFNDWEALAYHALAAEDLGYACYFGLSPRNPKKCFPTNELEPGKTASVKDILRRRWFLVDVDPQRPGGVCSTNAEKKAATAVLKEAVHWLCKVQGWPAPLLADSGNGHHALFRVDLPPEDDRLVERCLSTLASKFSKKQAKIDTGVFDSARICRLYGTKNCKGESTPERPHRVSRLLGTNNAKPVPIEKLEAVALLALTTPVNSANSMDRVSNFGFDSQDRCAATMARMLNKDRDDDKPPIEDYEIPLYAKKWMNDQPLAVSGDGGDKQTFKVACGLIVGHGLSINEARPILEEYNENLSGAGEEPWTENELEHKLQYADRAAENDPDRVGWMLRQITGNKEGEQRGTQVQQLLKIIESQAELWHTPDDHLPFASVKMTDHTANLAVRGKAFEEWLGGAFYRATGTVANREALANAVQTASGLALFEGDQHPVFVRVAGHDGKIYLDLANKKWEVIEIDANGWRVITNPPVKFRRPGGTLPLETPVSGGTIDELRPFLNVTDEDFMLLVAWLLMVLSPDGDYPILILNGEQGSAKSTVCRLLRSLIDPNKAPLRRFAKTDDLLLAANNSQILAFDNLSRVKNDNSDLLCSIATGLGDAKRELYTDLNEIIIQVRRPVMINGITNVATRGDLLDRCLVVTLPSLADKQTGDEEEPAYPDEHYSARDVYEPQFKVVKPAILGALLDGAVHALANKHKVSGKRLPRMADFARWVMAGVGAFGWDQTTFRAAYANNRQASKGIAAEDSAIVPVLRRVLEDIGNWSGTATQLLDHLDRAASLNERTRGWWPKKPQNLSEELARLAPILRAEDIHIKIGRRPGGMRERFIDIRKLETGTTGPALSSRKNGKKTREKTAQKQEEGL
ncbi:hypothetical protein [Symmachiella dynata]|uniref:hypothetical protein n=1 Tax=Symmachiella dynata TaxID=2527995 RepID=UPI0030EB71F9